MPPESFDIRYSEIVDLQYLKKWFEEENACDPFPFDFEEKDQALQNWIGFSKFKSSLTGTVDQVPCAIGTLFLMPYKKVSHHCSFFLIVDPKFRNQGIGTSMVRNLMNLAKSRFKFESIHVEFFEPNPLSTILKKLQFTEVIRQQNYVKLHSQPVSRIIMEHDLHG